MNDVTLLTGIDKLDIAVHILENNANIINNVEVIYKNNPIPVTMLGSDVEISDDNEKFAKKTSKKSAKKPAPKKTLTKKVTKT